MRHAAELRLREVVARIDEELVPWVPLLGILLGLDLPPTPETSSLDERFLRDTLADVALRFLVDTLGGTATMLAVEDVQFMDEASADLLVRLSRAAGSLRYVLVVTHSDPATTWAPVDDDDLRCLAFTLRPLTDRQAAEIIQIATDERPLAPHVVEEIARRSGGNVLFLFELLDMARATGTTAALPDSVEAVIAADIDRLSPSDRMVLRSASVLGASFDRGLLAATLDGEAELDDLLWQRLHGIVDPDATGRMRFRNTLVRDAAYEGLPFRRRSELHARVAQAIESAAASPDEEAPTLALHFFEAQPPRQGLALRPRGRRPCPGGRGDRRGGAVLRARARREPLRSRRHLARAGGRACRPGNGAPERRSVRPVVRRLPARDDPARG